MVVNDCELNTLFGGRVRVLQSRQGYRFSLDAILLGHFALGRVSGLIADLGTGCGILPIILARNPRVTKIVALEVQDDLARLASQNMALNGCQDRVAVMQADLRAACPGMGEATFDAVVANPPFYPEGAGRINPEQQQAIARHELHGTLEDFVAAAAFLLKPAGKFIAVFSAARVMDLLAFMRSRRIEPKAVQFIHPRGHEPATMVLAAGAKGAGVEATILPPLVVHAEDGSYTAAVTKIFDAL
jgi:tRNA1(Val) A37 N6-methylase TrmN6